MGLPTVFSLQYVPRALIVRGDAAATAGKVLRSEMLFRAGIVGELISGVGWILLVWTLYRLFEGVDPRKALLMLGLVVVSVAITFVNTVNDAAALTLFRRPEFLSAFDKRQLDSLAMLFLGLHQKGIFVNEVFWGLWLLPFGALVIGSGFLPRTLGILLIVNGLAYLISSLVSLLAPENAGTVHRWAIPLELGELWIALWLLIKGVRPRPLPAAAVRPVNA